MACQGSREKCLTNICSHLFKSVLCLQNFPLVLGMKPADYVCLALITIFIIFFFFFVNFSSASLHLLAY